MNVKIRIPQILQKIFFIFKESELCDERCKNSI